jgi:hypothetical protein
MIGDVLETAGNAVGQYFAKENASEAALAVADKNNFVMTEGYMNASEVEKAELMDKYLEANTHRSESYRNAFTNSIAYEYQTVHRNINKEADANTVKLAPSGYSSWSSIEGNEGKTRADYAKLMSSSTNNRVAPSVFMKSQLQYEASEWSSWAKNARTVEDLVAVKNDVNLEYEGFTKDFKNYVSSPEMQQAIKTGMSTFNQTVKAKETLFREEALMKINANRNTASTKSKMYQYTNPPVKEEYDIAYKDKAKAKEEFLKDTRKYEEAQGIREAVVNYTQTKSANRTGLTKDEEAAVQDNLDSNLIGLFEMGGLSAAGEVIRREGSVGDSKRLDKLRETIRDSLNSEDDSLETLAQLEQLRVSNKAAFYKLFPDVEESSKIMVLKPIMNLKNLTQAEAWRYLQEKPDPKAIIQERLSQTQKKKIPDMILDNDLNSNMKEDLTTINKTLEAYGVLHDDRVKVLKEYKEANPYEIVFEGSNRQKHYLNWALDQVKTDEDNKMYTQDGAIVQEDSWGFKVATIDKQAWEDYTDNMYTVGNYYANHPKGTWLENTFSNLALVLSRGADFATHAKIGEGHSITAKGSATTYNKNSPYVKPFENTWFMKTFDVLNKNYGPPGAVEKESK